jgi:hypothetical protein
MRKALADVDKSCPYFSEKDHGDTNSMIRTPTCKAWPGHSTARVREVRKGGAA